MKKFILSLIFGILLFTCIVSAVPMNMNNSLNVTAEYYKLPSLDVNGTSFNGWLFPLMNTSANGTYTGDLNIYWLVKAGILSPYQTAFSVNGYTDGANLAIIIIALVTLFMVWAKSGYVTAGILAIATMGVVGSLFEPTTLILIAGIVTVFITVSLMVFFFDRD